MDPLYDRLPTRVDHARLQVRRQVAGPSQQRNVAGRRLLADIVFVQLAGLTATQREYLVTETFDGDVGQRDQARARAEAAVTALVADVLLADVLTALQRMGLAGSTTARGIVYGAALGAAAGTNLADSDSEALGARWNRCLSQN
jgi:hypothetical protein